MGENKPAKELAHLFNEHGIGEEDGTEILRHLSAVDRIFVKNGVRGKRKLDIVERFFEV